jgi:hypothetical protein
MDRSSVDRGLRVFDVQQMRGDNCQWMASIAVTVTATASTEAASETLMPIAALRPCAEPRCPALVTKGRCRPTHGRWNNVEARLTRAAIRTGSGNPSVVGSSQPWWRQASSRCVAQPFPLGQSTETARVARQGSSPTPVRMGRVSTWTMSHRSRTGNVNPARHGARLRSEPHCSEVCEVPRSQPALAAESQKATTCGSTECRSARLRGKIVPRYDRVCRDCGQAFVSRQRQITVCRTCSKRAWKRPGKYRDRCERAGVPWVSGITAKKVCERDRYRCQLCGCKTPKRLRGTFEPNAPELDHIVPINAEGGSPGHAWHNVQCACRRCNLKKSATPLGQLRLAV